MDKLDQIKSAYDIISLMLALLDFTKNCVTVDFDDFNYKNVVSTEASRYGVEIGLLDKYEDEMYFVNEHHRHNLENGLFKNLEAFI